MALDQRIVMLIVGNTDLMKKELRHRFTKRLAIMFRWKYRPDEEGIKTGTRWCIGFGLEFPRSYGCKSPLLG